MVPVFYNRVLPTFGGSFKKKVKFSRTLYGQKNSVVDQD
jgi:hypothetical protein